MKIFKNRWTDIILVVLIVAMLIPQTRKPIQILVNQIFSFSPSVTEKEDREKLADYNWILQDLEGSRVDFSDYKGKVILVNYLATWCPPCIAEMPRLQELYTDYQDKVAFFFVSGEEPETVRKFLKKKNFDLPVYNMLSTDPKPLDGYSLPSTYVIDKKGNIVIHKVGAADWNSQKTRETLDELLAQ